MLDTMHCPVGPAHGADTPIFDYLFVGQHNCLGSLLVFQSFVQEVVTSWHRPTFVLIQEPPLVCGIIPFFGGFTCFYHWLSLGRPRVAT